MSNFELVELEPLECELYQVKEILKILLHSIVFQRALGESKLRDAESDLLDVSYVRCDSDTVCHRVEEYAESFSAGVEQASNRSAEQQRRQLEQQQQQMLLQQGAAGSSGGSLPRGSMPPDDSKAGDAPARMHAKICVAFFQRQNRPGAFGLFRGEEKVVWERWNLTLSVQTPAMTPESAAASIAPVATSAEGRRRDQQQLSEEIRQRLEVILTTASSRKEHIPPVDGLGGEAPWFEVTSDSDSVGLLDFLGRGFGRLPRAY